MPRIKATLATTAATLLTHTALASDAHDDVLLLINNQDQLVTGVVDFNAGTVQNTNARVFTATFDPFGTTDEPGFNALAATNPQLPADFSTLPASDALSFTAVPFTIDNQTANLFYWDATAAPAFTPASQSDIRVSKAPSVIFSATIDGSPNPIPGFTIDTAASSGFLHKHVDFTLTSPAAPDGVYAFALTLTAGPRTSEPIYLLHANGNVPSAQLEAAEAFIQSTLIQTPCPTDLNSSGITDLADLLIVLANFGVTPATTTQGDTNNDNTVNLQDLLTILAAFGQDC